MPATFSNPISKQENNYAGNPELLASNWYGGANHRYRLMLREKGPKGFRDQIQKKLWLTALAACLMLTTSFDNTLHPPQDFALTRSVSQSDMMISNATFYYSGSSTSHDKEKFQEGFDKAWTLVAINESHQIFTLYYTFAQGMTCVFNIMSLCSLLWINDSFSFHVLDNELDHFLRNTFTSFMLDLPTMLNWWAFFSMMFSWGIGIAIVTKDPQTEKVGKLALTLIGLGCSAFAIMFLLIHFFRSYNSKEARKYYVNIDGSPAFPELAGEKSFNAITNHGKDADDEYL